MGDRYESGVTGSEVAFRSYGAKDGGSASHFTDLRDADGTTATALRCRPPDRQAWSSMRRYGRQFARDAAVRPNPAM